MTSQDRHDRDLPRGCRGIHRINHGARILDRRRSRSVSAAGVAPV